LLCEKCENVSNEKKYSMFEKEKEKERERAK
jgi:hypothetical protein